MESALTFHPLKRFYRTAILKNKSNGTYTVTNPDPNDQNTYNDMTLEVDESNGLIKFTHQLKNDRSNKDYDYVPYTLTFTVQHNDDPNFKETIKIVQYPAMYIEAKQNSDYKGQSQSNNNNNGYVFVNRKNKGSGAYLGDANGLTGTNKNPNMYVIKVSSFPSNSEYIIGDPRSLQPNLLNYGNSWITASAIDGGNRKLQNYYPTNSDTSYENVISPMFRIASSYGVTSPIDYQTAQRRCASYQEDGYPAGRWRVPTVAEIKYMIQLANEEKIPVLLSPGTYYWSGEQNTACKYNSTDKVVITGTPGNWDDVYVRCVYDEWYWTDTVDKTKFTWGDQPRQ